MNQTMKQKYIRFVVIGIIFVIGITGYIIEYTRSARLNRDMTRAFDLIAMQSELERYFVNHHAYPKAEKALGAEGITSCSQEWESLAQTLDISLPRDPEQNCSTQFYGYQSDRIEYKIIAFPEICARASARAFYDPVRPCSSNNGAWMFASSGATQW
ncbi:MAG TPA: hypothetical protein VJB93_02205 [Patescibacteria group bacterium]|nr:hypothetical protein [Patescibacteria group bacterium]